MTVVIAQLTFYRVYWDEWSFRKNIVIHPNAWKVQIDLCLIRDVRRQVFFCKNILGIGNNCDMQKLLPWNQSHGKPKKNQLFCDTFVREFVENLATSRRFLLKLGLCPVSARRVMVCFGCFLCAKLAGLGLLMSEMLVASSLFHYQ